ncbi:TRAP transporter large permease subunit [Flaviflagellibacter deserti]|uniref:TRAP transporter large permease subunit n=1 Tax=Flaviflagellibacter deserti TaxID=2267266 RepID=A0ABV9Z3I4_9HYPH
MFLPLMQSAGVDLVWAAALIATILQTSFLTPPFGWALFYLRGVAPPEVSTLDIYKGVVPFIVLQLIALTLVFAFPGLATWLPEAIGW